MPILYDALTHWRGENITLEVRVPYKCSHTVLTINLDVTLWLIWSHGFVSLKAARLQTSRMGTAIPGRRTCKTSMRNNGSAHPQEIIGKPSPLRKLTEIT